MWLSNSSVGRKVVMSVTGIALVLFLTFHMAMNLVAIISADGYNMICEFCPVPFLPCGIIGFDFVLFGIIFADFLGRKIDAVFIKYL